MSFSFLVVSGDIHIQGDQLDIVYGLAKLEQDMQLWVAERYGIDRFHPQMGSLLQSYIGSTVGNGTGQAVHDEILRVLDLYGKGQIASFRSNPTLFSLSEMLYSIDTLDVSVNYDTVRAAISFTNGSGNSARIQVAAST